MKLLKKIGGLFLLVLTIGLIIFLFKYLVDETKKSILIVSEAKITPTPEELLYFVTKIIDGDTVIVKINGEEKSVRLIGIDAPEKNECFEKEATEKLKELIGNKKIKLEADETQNDKDKYDRLLRYIYLEDGTLINKRLIEEGMAKEYTYKIPYKFQMEFREVEKLAKEKPAGVHKCINLPDANE